MRMTQIQNDRVRYPGGIDPVHTDGRDVDTELGVLEGEGAQQLWTRPDTHLKRIAASPWESVPSTAGSDVTYYDTPMLKKSVWSIDIPLYYFVGGAAGAALTL